MDDDDLSQVSRDSLLSEWRRSPDASLREPKRLSSAAMLPYRFDRQLEWFDGANAIILIQQAEKHSIDVVIGSGDLLKKGYSITALAFLFLIPAVVYNIWLVIPFIVIGSLGTKPIGYGNQARTLAEYDRRFIVEIRRLAQLARK